jgi:dihydrolipoamide dehydrogenase
MSKPLHIGIIGGGPAGYVAALYAAAEGARVTLVEEGGMGGTCLQRGCIPTKRLVTISHLLNKMQEAENYGIELNAVPVADWKKMNAGVTKLVAGIEKGLDGLMANRKITVIQSKAKPIASIKPIIELSDGERIQLDRILICTGSNPHRPPSFPFNADTVCTSDELWHWQDLPKSLMIVGEGVIACEFAFIFKSLGVDVTMLGMMDKPLPTMDKSISSTISREMKKKKIHFKGGLPVTSLKQVDTQWQASSKETLLATAERVLVCTGRIPNTTGLNLGKNCIDCDKRGAIKVNKFMHTSMPNIYAAGDVTGGIMLAHAASAQAKVAIAHMMDIECQPYDVNCVPSAVFTTPEVAAVGLTEEQASDLAEEQGTEISIGTFDMRALGKAHAMGEIAGNIKLIAEKGSRRLLGAHMVGANVTEIIHEATMVIARQGTVDDITHTIHAHPTLSEAVLEAAEDVFDQACHKPLKKQRTDQSSDINNSKKSKSSC